MRVLVLAGGEDFWSNGIHLNVIEAASLGDGSAADESWNNINAMNDVCLAILQTTDRLTVAALRGNAGAGAGAGGGIGAAARGVPVAARQRRVGVLRRRSPPPARRGGDAPLEVDRQQRLLEREHSLATIANSFSGERHMPEPLTDDEMKLAKAPAKAPAKGAELVVRDALGVVRGHALHRGVRRSHKVVRLAPRLMRLDRRVHGGPEKAVHLYPAAHYARLAARFPEAAGELLPGSLGENISSPSLDETQVRADRAGCSVIDARAVEAHPVGVP